MVSVEDFGEYETEWCPGCGNFMILKAIKRALAELGKEPHEVLLTSGIGQSSKLPHYLKCNVFNGLHGRSLPPAIGAKVANHELTVLAVTGDGDCYGEGGNHFVHNIRRNPDITLIVHDNQIYGLTKGQASPTSELGMKTKIQNHGVFNTPLNPLSLAISLDCSFVSRGFAGDVEHLTELIKKAIQHKGFSLVDVLQPCVSFNKLNTFKWYSERVYRMEEKDHSPKDRVKAFEKSLEWGERIPLGVFYVNEKPTFEDHLDVLSSGSLVKNKADPKKVDELLDSFI
ncbi:2-oxoacid:ferredoxin oxidoreductase subunit beta [Methanococcoides burtonii]|uniref:Protein containing C-terminal TPP-binding domain and 2-oxoacid:acceptor oxidoreductase, beta subunit, pyruvate/2-ketoisovalerate-like domain n=1 Tax=Methanococcoides burtonii (strain DSM 6242 / NBRC 107633 / OCM 468 / ACE-M) TaxID=259564 RepID=Q12XI8_METBU|nr:2-oxoacid:ferredoxin oxidoreductase subunit beta [Methanococcoides burtonii]ABE51838.1 Protein containing C-terminal TPP-binding domain and 2-oxoacid:acceptor oxidoreductase, beta subunit, pyruvate/2-ketoisovalerate-like domain [Methanococcoides burtonii DSM 6242]